MKETDEFTHRISHDVPWSEWYWILIHIIPKKRTLENFGNIRFQIKLEFVPLEVAINAEKLGNRASDAKR